MVVLSEFVGGPSSSSSIDHHTYDVFLSFRGADTRNGFTDYLHMALVDAGITTFLDDEQIETGEDPRLERAIKASRASIIVLSKNYAFSTCCLHELVLILEQRMASNHIVIPIFYHVEPTHVRRQQSTFGLAMAEHRQRMESETNADNRSELARKIDQWNKALTEVANLKGMMDVFDRRETEFIEEIVKEICRRLRISSRFPLPQLMGMDSAINFVTSWLNDASSHTADVLSILGMSGIGKTSLAKYVYGLHSLEFGTSSFIEDISRRCENNNGMLRLQKQLYDDISERGSIQVHDVSIYTTMIENEVARKKVFIVLDDIDSLDQLDALLGSKDFHPASKLIITTKVMQLTESCALFQKSGKARHAHLLLNGLEETESRKLLCFHAFVCNDPKEGYEEVLDELVKYCEGHPLALEVLGKCLHNRDVDYWTECIAELKKDTDSLIYSALKKSFDSLPSENDKEFFKHVACFFVGIDKDVAETILEACHINTSSGFMSLIDRCLLSIGWDNELKMHKLIQEMGRLTVREESPDRPWKRSRLWCHEESLKTLSQNKGTGNILGLALDTRKLEKEKLRGSFELKTEALSKMDSLMLLQLNYVRIKGSYENFPEELRWLCMHGFSLESIPSDLRMENVVALDLSYSYIESFGVCYGDPQQLQKRRKRLTDSSSKVEMSLGSLKILNLSFCHRLHSLGGFENLPALERLIVKNCTDLLEVCESIEECAELVLIDLSFCNKLKRLPRTISMLKNVKSFLLDGCDLNESTIWSSNMDSSIVLETIPRDMKFFKFTLPASLVKLSLENNNLTTESFPMDFSFLRMLKELYLDCNPIVSLPNCVRSLPRLETLSISNCKILTSVEHPPHTLRELILHFDSKPLLRKVVFDPDMSPLKLSFDLSLFIPSSFEVEGMVKIQPMVDVEENLLQCLGWTKLDFLKEMRVGTFSEDRGPEESQIQMYYEFGIFSTIYEGKNVPDWFSHTSEGPSISFTIPSSPNNLRGLNFCSVQANLSLNKFVELPVITIKNVTKNHTWLYKHCIGVVSVGGICFIMLSHWMFGKSEMDCGDKVTIIVATNSGFTNECGVSLVYEEEEEGGELGYYKSWNHIIGGDLTGFQLTTGEYILHSWRFMPSSNALDFTRQFIRCGIADWAIFKEPKVCFRALSQRKPNLLDQAHEIDRENPVSSLVVEGPTTGHALDS